LHVLALLGGVINHARLLIAGAFGAGKTGQKHRGLMVTLAVTFFFNLALTVTQTVPLERRAGGLTAVDGAASEGLFCSSSAFPCPNYMRVLPAFCVFWLTAFFSLDISRELLYLHRSGAAMMLLLLVLNFAVWNAQQEGKDKSE
jgi:hypothetical protein